MESLIELSEKDLNMLLYECPIINTPLKNNIKILFADNTASGRPSPIVENYMNTKILPYYSNTHSNSYCGILMKNYIAKTRNVIRSMFNIDNNKLIIFTGSGTTCAINHLIHCLHIEDNAKTNILLTNLEHHSNYLPWVELARNHKSVNLMVIPCDNNLNPDIDFIERVIKANKTTMNIITITACSNVLGNKIDIIRISDVIKKNNNNNNNLFFIDYACSAPYIKIDGNICDAFFFSPHKFIGGIGTPGVLIADKKLFHNKVPFTPGGGCVKNVCNKVIEYENNIEKKESAGTPNITGIIKISIILRLQRIFLNIIEHNERIITQYIFSELKNIQRENNRLIVIFPDIEHRLPITCIAIKDYHYNLIVILLNDLFGIQSRGGVSCTGLLADIIKNKYNIQGWCRITFNWTMKKTDIYLIIDAIRFVTNNIHKYADKYVYDKNTNLYTHINFVV